MPVRVIHSTATGTENTKQELYGQWDSGEAEADPASLLRIIIL